MEGGAGGDPDRELRLGLTRLVQRLLAAPAGEGEPIGPLIEAHLGEGAAELPVLAEELGSWELVNVQLALDVALDRAGWSAQVLGLGGGTTRFMILGLADLLAAGHHATGPPQYVNADAGPGRQLACLDFGVLLVTSPEGPICLFLRRGDEGGPGPGLSLQATSPEPGLARSFLADVRRLALEHDVFRGQMITIEITPQGQRRIVFLERPRLERDALVLPDGVLERIERHVIGPTRHREALVAAGRHLGRGLLLWGPPGTGKTLTVRYLASRMQEATVIVLSGGSLEMVGAFGALARRLAPSLVVLEDVDLVAEERHFGPSAVSSPVLFELMDEMSGLDEDADVAFVLTTNRADVLEPALAARPGRVDLAVEIPLPDEDGRRRLLDLYGRGLDLRLQDPWRIVQRTGGVTASFIKELLRKTALAVVEAGRTTITDVDVQAALDELLSETQAITRVLLGGAGDRYQADGPRGWLERLPEPEEPPEWPPRRPGPADLDKG